MLTGLLLIALTWLLLNELLPLGMLTGTLPYHRCPGQCHLPPRTWVRAAALPPGDGGYTVVIGPWRWVVVALSLPLEWVPALLAHEAAHIRRGHPRKLWLLAVLGLHRTRRGQAYVAKWEAQVDLDVDVALGRAGAGTGLRLELRRQARAAGNISNLQEVADEAQG